MLLLFAGPAADGFPIMVPPAVPVFPVDQTSRVFLLRASGCVMIVKFDLTYGNTVYWGNYAY